MKTLSTGAFKRFTVTVLKLACGIALATLMLGLAVWGIVTFRERSEEAANAPLATLKTWPEITVNALANIKVRLRTVWRGGNIYYQFDVQGYSPELRQAMERETQAAFTIDFLDNDGFRLFEHRLALAEMSEAMGADGQPAGASWKGDEFVVADLYRRATRWELGSSGFAPAPAPGPVARSAPSVPQSKPVSPPLPKPVSPARPRWRDVSLWRGLSHGMSQDDVKRILGEPEKIADLGFMVTWYYGYPEGGQVMFGRDGRLESWLEP